MHNRGGLGITERDLNLLLSSADIKAEEGVYLGGFSAIPPRTSKATHGLRQLQGSYSCHATVLLSRRTTQDTLKGRKLGVVGRDRKTTAALLQACYNKLGAKGAHAFLNSRLPSPHPHKKPLRSYGGNILKSPFSAGWLRTEHIPSA